MRRISLDLTKPNAAQELYENLIRTQYMIVPGNTNLITKGYLKPNVGLSFFILNDGRMALLPNYHFYIIQDINRMLKIRSEYPELLHDFAVNEHYEVLSKHTGIIRGYFERNHKLIISLYKMPTNEQIETIYDISFQARQLLIEMHVRDSAGVLQHIDTNDVNELTWLINRAQNPDQLAAEEAAKKQINEEKEARERENRVTREISEVIEKTPKKDYIGKPNFIPLWQQKEDQRIEEEYENKKLKELYQKSASYITYLVRTAAKMDIVGDYKTADYMLGRLIKAQNDTKRLEEIAQIIAKMNPYDTKKHFDLLASINPQRFEVDNLSLDERLDMLSENMSGIRQYLEQHPQIYIFPQHGQWRYALYDPMDLRQMHNEQYHQKLTSPFKANQPVAKVYEWLHKKYPTAMIDHFDTEEDFLRDE